MFFEDAAEIEGIAKRNGTSIFVVPRNLGVEIPEAVVLRPEEKSVITMEQIRRMQENVAKRQVEELVVLIRPAEQMTEAGQNALLKTLEQPGERVHFALITDRPMQLLSTIRSRAKMFVLKREEDFFGPVVGSEKNKRLARRLLTSSGAELTEVAKEVAKARTGEVRGQAFEVLEIAVEIAYKSYFKTGKRAFLLKIPRLIRAYENIAQGGNIKLQIVGNMV